MKICNTPKELTETINNQLFDFLNKDFKEYLRETEREMIYKNVYSYRATDYAMNERRYDNGGLADMSNIKAVPYINEGAVLYINNTFPQEVDYISHPLSLAEAVEVGDSDWHMDKSAMNNGPGARPFTQDTVDKMATSRRTYSIFKEYFNKLGIKTIQNK